MHGDRTDIGARGPMAAGIEAPMRHRLAVTIALASFAAVTALGVGMAGADPVAESEPDRQARLGGALPAAGQSPTYRLVKEIPVGGEGGWDYLAEDAAAHRLYVSHGTKIVVIDMTRDAVVGEIEMPVMSFELFRRIATDAVSIPGLLPELPAPTVPVRRDP